MICNSKRRVSVGRLFWEGITIFGILFLPIRQYGTQIKNPDSCTIKVFYLRVPQAGVEPALALRRTGF